MQKDFLDKEEVHARYQKLQESLENLSNQLGALEKETEELGVSLQGAVDKTKIHQVMQYIKNKIKDA